MKKRFQLTNLDCANCAAKMERAIQKLDGVHEATVSFMTQKLTLDADDDRFEEILKRSKQPFAKLTPTVPFGGEVWL